MFLSIDSSNGYSNLLITDENFNKRAESISGFHENHSILIFKQLDEIMCKAGIKLNDLTGIAVILGPGSYTGIRVSLTIAKTLSYVLGVNIIGLGSLSVCAYWVVKKNLNFKNIVAVKDASKGRYYVSEHSCANKNFTGQIKINLFALGELRSFLNNMEDEPFLVYGLNKEKGRAIINEEFKNLTSRLLFFDLKQTAYYASMYALENKKEDAGLSLKKIKYAEELSPYYVYGNGPF